ncbi:MAG TPA: 23S rRNA (uracil(1939)-C(5))-methyltransferase RlmD [Terracidiphilus sp.]|nr:23S rRNA (uracil(1939)-C(5))-methyltransferase RlmD [Terracidiphilus sp.]
MKPPPHLDRRKQKSPRGPARALLVQIEKPVYGGEFLTRVEGKAVFVPLVMPGEEVRVRTVTERSGFAKAEAEAVVAASPKRIVPACPHFGTCGGCDYQHTDYATQSQWKLEILRETMQRAGVQPPQEIDVLAAAPWGYRNRIRVALDTAGSVGYRGRRSHGIVPIRECPISAPLLVKAALFAGESFRKMEPARRPSEVALFCDAEESALLTTVFVDRPAKAGAEDFARALKEHVPQLAGVEFVSEGLAGRQPRTVARSGAASILYRAAGFDYRVDEGAFFQVNRWLVDALVDRVALDQGGALAWDLFAGVGLFARKLTERFERVIAVESSPAAIAALRQNLKETSSQAVHADTLAFLRETGRDARPDLVVVDPPRTGLDKEVAALLAEAAAAKMVYVSCDPATLARDLHVLVESGYRVDSMTLADLFPQTFHLETVVRLSRA